MSTAYIIARIFDFIFFLLILRIFLSWFPNIHWYEKPFALLKAVTDFFLEPFRKIIPPVGMLDISPIVCFLVLSLMRNLLIKIVLNLGL